MPEDTNNSNLNGCVSRVVLIIYCVCCGANRFANLSLAISIDFALLFDFEPDIQPMFE